MLKMKNVAKLLTGIGALAVSIHTAGMLFVYCSGNIQCAATAQFGIVEYAGTPLILDSGSVPLTTVAVSETGGTLFFSDMHALVQSVGLYLILIGITLMLILEMKELRLLRSMRRVVK